MDIELAVRAVCSLPKIIGYKLRYGKRLQTTLVHGLGKKTRFILRGSGFFSLGKELVTRENCQFRVESGSLQIGDKCFFNLNSSITCMESISIGDGCQIGNNVVMVDHNHTKDLSGYTTKPVKIGKRVWIGANCVILPGAVIGDGAVIGAGSIVNKTVSANATYYNKRISVVVREE